LADLFGGRSQLLVYHFMFGPEYTGGCPACSAIADGFNGFAVHLANHDVMLWAVSRAPIDKLEAYRQRMGWKFPWASSKDSDFNFDYHVSFSKADVAKKKIFYNYETTQGGEEQPGISVFHKTTKGEIFHTYSSYGRGGDLLIGTYNYLDLTPLGRQEKKGGGMDWVRFHDRYVSRR